MRLNSLSVGTAIFQEADPIGSGLGKEAVVEAAGPECIVPGQVTPIKLLGLKVPLCLLLLLNVHFSAFPFCFLFQTSKIFVNMFQVCTFFF